MSLLIIPTICSAAEIIKCQDSNGNVVFTQNRSDCSGKVEYKSVNLPTQYSRSDKERVSYRYPKRDYIRERGRWDIRIEKELFKGAPDLYKSSRDKLNDVLDDVFSLLPSRAANNLSDLTIFLMWGEESANGGRKSGMSYIRKGEPNNYAYLDPEWGHSLVIYSANNLIYLNKLWSRKAIMHELAHAWHIMNWPEKHPPIYDAWNKTKNSSRFKNVKEVKGKTIKNAYARKNQLEYFAELSAIYFVGGNYYPYHRKGLEKYDPEGYKMVQALWQ